MILSGINFFDLGDNCTAKFVIFTSVILVLTPPSPPIGDFCIKNIIN
jgi:hypothetical protein